LLAQKYLLSSSKAHIRCSQRRILEEIAEPGLLEMTVGCGVMTESGSLPFLLPTCSCLPSFSVRCGRLCPLPAAVSQRCPSSTNRFSFLFAWNMIQDCTAGVRRQQLVGWSQPKAAAYLNRWPPPAALAVIRPPACCDHSS
jgi:hypothetical protein